MFQVHFLFNKIKMEDKRYGINFIVATYLLIVACLLFMPYLHTYLYLFTLGLFNNYLPT
jgi:hypothetical protein